MILQVITLVLLTVTAASEECRYAKFTSKHSFCKPRNHKCKIFDTGLNDTDKLLLVKLHNKYRSKIAQGKEKGAGGMPPAADMLEIVRLHGFISYILLYNFYYIVFCIFFT